MHSKRGLACLASVVVVVLPACGKKSSGGGGAASLAAPTAPFLLAADVAPGGNLNTPTQTQMLGSISSAGALYYNQPSSASTPSACDAVLNGQTIQATASTFTLAFNVDLTACTQQDQTAATSSAATPAQGTSSVTQVSLEIYLTATCEGYDVSSMNGKTLGSIANTKALQSCTSGTFIVNSKSTYAASATANGKTSTFSATTVDYQGTADLKPCSGSSAGGTWTWADGCEQVERSDTSATDGTSPTPVGNEDYAKYAYQKLTDTVGSTAPWHSGGSLAVVYDNWTGTVTYKDANTAPTYSLTPTGGQAVTGSITATAGLALGLF